MSFSRKLMLVSLWGLVLAAGLGFAWFQVIKPKMTQQVVRDLGVGDYVLTSTDGKPFTQDSLLGQPSAVFFGFTHCPEVCPTTLGDIATWQEELGKDGEDLRVFFVTVDPERDTEAVLGDYVSWVPGVVGVTGDPAEMKKAIKAYKAYAQKVPLEDGGYTMDHSASVMLFDAKGQYFGVIGYQEGEERSMATLHRLLDS